MATLKAIKKKDGVQRQNSLVVVAAAAKREMQVEKQQDKIGKENAKETMSLVEKVPWKRAIVVSTFRFVKRGLANSMQKKTYNKPCR